MTPSQLPPGVSPNDTEDDPRFIALDDDAELERELEKADHERDIEKGGL